MVRFKGRSAWKTVIKGKPTPIGYKCYTVASHGYLLGFQVYRGKGGYATRQGVLHHSVVQLVERWAHSNRILFFDNLYTSQLSAVIFFALASGHVALFAQIAAVSLPR
jgi:hypothetical protein